MTVLHSVSRKITPNKFTHFKPIRSCNRYDLTTGTVSSPLSENGVKDFVEASLVNMQSIKKSIIAESGSLLS